MTKLRFFIAATAIASIAACSGDEVSGKKSSSDADSVVSRTMADASQWPSYGRDYSNRRFSPLTQITATNVNRLEVAWTFHTGIPKAFENSPVVIAGTMYISTPDDHVIALDAKTGVKKWEYAPVLRTTVHCCGPVNRGVAVYDGKVYLGTLDARLIALDARDGHFIWQAVVEDNKRGYSETMAPVAVDGKILIGISGAEYGIRGFISAYDAVTGALVWRFYTIPAPNEAPNGWWGQWRETDAFGTSLNRNIAKEKTDSATYAEAWRTGGASVWQSPTVDLQRRLVIFNVGNASPDLESDVRPGENLYTNSIVALDLDTGKLKWYFQEVPHDAWDLDAASPVILVDVTDGAGKKVAAVAQAGKTGWVYVVDRNTGKPIRRSDAFVPQTNMFARPTIDGVRMLPGANGGSEWSPAAYSPETGYMYVLGIHQPMLYKVKKEKLTPPAFWLGGLFLPTGEDQYGLFSAVDLNTGKIAWQQKVPDPMIGGAMVTAGGVVFVGTADKRFLAFDARTGRQLWSYEAHAGVNAPPVSYAIGGKQFVAAAIGGNYQINSPRGDEIVAFTLAGPSATISRLDTLKVRPPVTRTGPRFY
jgi:PQQ-dependent dehydrogenase (methanol/ethanol family)